MDDKTRVKIHVLVIFLPLYYDQALTRAYHTNVSFKEKQQKNFLRQGKHLSFTKVRILELISKMMLFTSPVKRKDNSSMRSLSTPLVSNGSPLDMSPARLAWLEPTSAELPIAALRETYQQQGYLWLKHFFEQKVVLDFRSFFEEMLSAGEKTFFEVVRSQEYEAFCTMPRLWQFYQAFLGGQPHLHKRKLIRFSFPGLNYCTGGHYDLIYLRAGADTFSTSWIPLGDIPVEMGGLIYLEHSDALGRKFEAEFSMKNAHLSPEERISAYNRNMREDGWISTNLAEMAERFNSRWLIADYEAGDMVIHSPYMIHAATQNCDPKGRMRLSTDIRFQRADDQLDPRWASDWAIDDNL